MRNIYFIKSCEEYVSHTFKKNLFKMKNSKNDFPLVWSKTKAPTASLPVVMTLRWQTAGRWGSWGWSHTCTTSLGNSWVWSWRLALHSVWRKTSSQAGACTFAQKTPSVFKQANGTVDGFCILWFCEFFHWDGEIEEASTQPHHPSCPSLSYQFRALSAKQVSHRKPREWRSLFISILDLCLAN